MSGNTDSARAWVSCPMLVTSAVTAERARRR